MLHPPQVYIGPQCLPVDVQVLGDKDNPALVHVVLTTPARRADRRGQPVHLSSAGPMPAEEVDAWLREQADLLVPKLNRAVARMTL